MKAAKTTIIECVLDSFSNKNYIMLAWQNTDRDALLESAVDNYHAKITSKKLEMGTVRKVILHTVLSSNFHPKSISELIIIIMP
jgi:hypothetical protein